MTMHAKAGASAEGGVAGTSSSPGRGLVNLGRTSCFLSSVLQVLAHLPSVRSQNLRKEEGCAATRPYVPFFLPPPFSSNPAVRIITVVNCKDVCVCILCKDMYLKNRANLITSWSQGSG